MNSGSICAIGYYRVRAGDYRIVYQVKDQRLLVLVLEIGHRREVYR
ncbi:MAG: type II toxin-antitoxin system RelE/ParE family toxin [Magnetococcales bacterium]|nr:type II toxin-antitoxin system RelE/ParE family toxin [Magnetococcales bacterium]